MRLGLVALIFGAIKKRKEITDSALELWKSLKGERPKEIIHNHSTGVSIVVKGDGNKISVTPEVARLYDDDRTRSATAKIVSPVGRTGIEKFEVRKDSAILSKIDKDELPEWIRETTEVTGLIAAEVVEKDTRETLLTIVRPNFDKQGRWGFAEGSAKFSAKVEDKEFLAKVKNRDIPFYSGDVFRVRLRTEHAIDSDGRVKTTHTIEEFLPLRRHSPSAQLKLKSEDHQSPAGGRNSLPPSQE